MPRHTPSAQRRAFRHRSAAAVVRTLWTAGLAGTLVGTLLGAQCDTPSADAGPDTGVTWREAFRPGDAGSMSAVWGTAPDRVWAVGGGEQGAILRFDGDSWQPEAVPAVPLLVWVHGTGPDDVWAVGVGGGALHYDGSAWARIDTGTGVDLWGVFAAAPDDVWVVGGYVDRGEPVTLHWNGEAFEPHALAAAENPLRASAFFKVWGTGDLRVAVGQRGLIAHWVDGAWKSQPAGAEANDDFVSLWGTDADHIVAVGGRSNARIARYDGQAWQTDAPFGYGGLNGVFLETPERALIVGVFGLAATYNPRTGDIIEEDSTTRFDLHAVWSDQAGRAYAVGGNFLPPYAGVARVREVSP